MSLSASLANALSGLTAASRRAEVVSANVANATTEGYARRELALSPLSLGGSGAGVRVGGVTRAVDMTVLSDLRLANAEAGGSGMRADFFSQIEALLGAPGEAGSLTERVSAFQTKLTEAASRPDSAARLQSVVDAGNALTATLRTLSGAVQQARMDADAGIAGQVSSLNDALGRVADLNAEITAQRATGHDAAALMDERQRLIDGISAIVPLREVARPNDQVALYTTGGAILLDGSPATIGFTRVGVITPDMSLGGGSLGGLTLNGMTIASGDDGLLAGGTLAAAFAVRDRLAPAVQGDLDAFARDLIERFEAPGLDPTLTSSDPGLLTDAGAMFTLATEEGIAARITFNAAADPARGGALWRLRDGLGATAAGNVGDATLLTAFGSALASTRVAGSGNAAGVARSAAGLAADLVSAVAGDRLGAEAGVGSAAARQSALKELQLADGVDTDAEMQSLLMIEQAYSANARVIQTIDDLIQQLIGL
ncbi:MAG: flagellar hook-associated protein FlgK [Defluviimonas sp.]|uniref:flagellar hook-associated protein FlgK n=1 Tax=Albidovulum sp. TaxID=1872424 RepID=UPI001DE45B7D|nr:flagellar hook-associated protein FlgK [Paracoccaceae bacterium]MCC0062863.1 flagellar hook-associated protein FlgK [Defluviimonas sp.]